MISRFGSERPPVEFAKSGQDFSIGIFEPGQFTIHWSLFVSHPELKIEDTNEKINVYSAVIGGFRLTLLWSFIPLQSPFAAGSFMPHIIPSEPGENTLAGLLTFDKSGAFGIHADLNIEFFEQVLDLSLRTMVFPTLVESLMWRRILGHYGMLRSGISNSLEYMMFRAGAPQLPDDQFDIGVRDI